MNQVCPQPKMRWAWRKCNTEKLQEHIVSSEPPSNQAGAEQGSLAMAQYLEQSCDSCMPRGTYRWRKKPCHWWTEEIASLKRNCLSARRSLHGIHHLQATEDSDKLAAYKASKKIP